MSAAERIEWWSDHPVLLWRLHPCDEIWDALDDDPANDNCPLAPLAKTFPEPPNWAATCDNLILLPLARGALCLQARFALANRGASTRQGRGDAFRSALLEGANRTSPISRVRTSVGRGLPHWRDTQDWPEGAKPVTKKIEYDDLYRATRIRYEYSDGDDEWKSPFQAEIDGNAANDDSRRAQPSPHVSFDRRMLQQTFEYDWVGNNRNTGDNENGFYDRSLGTIDDNDEAGKPYQLKGAALSGPNGGSLQARYDAAGYMTKMQLARDGACIGGSNPGDCDQQFVYEWDEVGRLSRARRWDNNATSVDTFSPASAGTPAADLRHTYDASDQRVLKEAVDGQGNKSFTAYVFETLELRRAQFGEAFDDGAAPSVSDYEISHYTVVPYLLANGVRLSRVVYHASGDVPDETYNASGAPGDVNGPLTSSGKLHVFFELGDYLGSTSVVLDKATGELVERATLQGYGGAESDYRPDRWKSFREDYRFTGKEEDVEVGLQYFGKRYLNPLLGRWISADPLAVHSPGEADLNVYAYVSGKVLQSTDPLGLRSKEAQQKIDEHQDEKAQVEHLKGELDYEQELLQQEIDEKSYLKEVEATDRYDLAAREQEISDLKASLKSLELQEKNLDAYWGQKDAAYKLWRSWEESLVHVEAGLPGSRYTTDVRQEDLSEHKSMERYKLALATVDLQRDGGLPGVLANAVAHAIAIAKTGKRASLEQQYVAGEFGKAANQLAEVRGAMKVGAEAPAQAATSKASRQDPQTSSAGLSRKPSPPKPPARNQSPRTEKQKNDVWSAGWLNVVKAWFN